MRKRKKRLLACRGLRSDIRQETYGKICDADPGRAAHAGGPKAMTAVEYIEKQRRKVCKIFRGSGEICEREACGHPRDRHKFVWRKEAAA